MRLQRILNMGTYPRFQGMVDNMSNNPQKYFMLNRLLNEAKPLKVGDSAHLTTWEGMFKVYGVDARFFVIMKNHVYYRIPWEHLKCVAGSPGSSTRARSIRVLETLLREVRAEKGRDN